jgi:hypothetical protein
VGFGCSYWAASHLHVGTHQDLHLLSSHWAGPLVQIRVPFLFSPPIAYGMPLCFELLERALVGPLVPS